MFIVALFVIIKNYKNPNILPGEWINQLWYIHTRENYN